MPRGPMAWAWMPGMWKWFQPVHIPSLGSLGGRRPTQLSPWGSAGHRTSCVCKRQLAGHVHAGETEAAGLHHRARPRQLSVHFRALPPTPEVPEAAISESTAGPQLTREPPLSPSQNKQPAPRVIWLLPLPSAPRLRHHLLALLFHSLLASAWSPGPVAGDSSPGGAESWGAIGDTPHPCPQLDPCHTSLHPRLVGRPPQGHRRSLRED